PLEPAAALRVLQLEPGREVRGVVAGDDGRPPGGVVVEVRASSGTLGGEPRLTTTADDGAFAFAGLPDGVYTVFAHRRIDGVTWSGQLRGVTPGPDEWLLRLRNEDPAPPGGERR